MACGATVECKSALGLYCSTTGYQCECPTSLPAGRCDCTSSQYYKDATFGCGKQNKREKINIFYTFFIVIQSVDYHICNLVRIHICVYLD